MQKETAHFCGNMPRTPPDPNGRLDPLHQLVGKAMLRRHLRVSRPFTLMPASDASSARLLQQRDSIAYLDEQYNRLVRPAIDHQAHYQRLLDPGIGKLWCILQNRVDIGRTETDAAGIEHTVRSAKHEDPTGIV